MADREARRRLAAILAADVAGYTRRMEADSEGTVAAWQDAREDVVKPSVGEFSGKIVKLTGDGFLVEFATVQDAVNCAIAMQRGLASSSLDFRIGINLGDIIDDGEDIHGEGVNVAARLEGLAEPGGICISGDVYNQVRNRIDAGYRDMGLQEVKNVSAPVQAYSIQMDVAGDEVAISAAAKPSIAVLPFDNLSGDPEQEYFSDGITEDIITALSRIRQFFVIARNTTFTYRGQAVDVRTVASELGVGYVLEGSVRKAGNRVRITAQLIDGATGNHLWAEKYDRELEDIFALQDEITQTVVGSIEPELARAEQARGRQKPTESLGAWETYQQGLWHMWQSTKDGRAESMRLFKRASEIDPMFASAHAGVAFTHTTLYLHGEGVAPLEALNAALEAGRKAVALDAQDAVGHWALGFVFLFRREFSTSPNEYNKSIEINPSYAQAHIQIGLNYAFSGRPELSFAYFAEAKRLSPKDPQNWVRLMGHIYVHYLLGNYEEALVSAQEAINDPGSVFWVWAMQAATLARLGRSEEARAALDQVFATNPRFSLAFVRRTGPYAESTMADILDGLRLAGLRED